MPYIVPAVLLLIYQYPPVFEEHLGWTHVYYTLTVIMTVLEAKK
jgi:hypothetical protein